MAVAYVFPSTKVPTVAYHQEEVSSEGLLHDKPLTDSHCQVPWCISPFNMHRGPHTMQQ